MSNELEQNPTPDEGRNNEAQPLPVTPEISPGTELARRREELNLTVEQVAAHLNLAPRQIEAIEADNFDALPGMAIARGFVRSYAKVVGIDADPLLAAMAPAVPPVRETAALKPALNKPLSGKNLSFDERSSRKSKTLWVVLGLVLIVIVAILAIRQSGSLSWPGADEEAAPAAGTGQPETNATPDGRAVEVLPAPDVPAEPAPAAPADASDASSSSAPAVTPAPVQAVAESGNSGADSNALLIKAREESWVEWKRPDGTVLVSRLIEGGSEASFPLRGEMILTVGNAAGVDVMLRGQALDLENNARGNVARLNVK